MTGINPDLLVARRRLQRSVALWRTGAFLTVIALVVFIVDPDPSAIPIASNTNHIAVIDIDGVILNDSHRERAIRNLKEDDSAEALLVRIDSPGGTTFGSEALYRAIRSFGEERPIVAVMKGVAASGGYMAALAGDHILARETTITGSIGVVLEATNYAGLMEKLGIENELVRSVPLKAEPNPFNPMSTEAREANQQVVNDVHRMFVDLLTQRRAMPRDKAARLADGRVYTGAMAVRSGLVDAIGGTREAVTWLENEAGIKPGLPLREVMATPPEGLVDRILFSVFGNSVTSQTGGLQGLVSLWRPLTAD